MWTVILLAFMVGLDNFLVATGLGAGGLDKKQRWMLVCGFAFFEALMPLLGLYMGQTLAAELAIFSNLASPIALLCCGLLVLSGIYFGSRSVNVYQRVLPLLPLLLSFDNLMAGTLFGAMSFPITTTALIVGGCSGLMGFAGLMLGDKVGRLVPLKTEMLCGVWLVIAAVALVL